ncbi:MAG: 4-hydroxy-tetrahydrodipicolinate reductase [Candidatus Omnitrophota bacterium]|nr:MAG: 4-hydroxy-tetrahydrodipicolinate reductase [Candidatus Omnitrophota bacterium]
MVKIVVSGALGRMGKRITELARKDAAFKVVAGVELKAPSPKPSPQRGEGRVRGMEMTSDLNQVKGGYDCIIEFTNPKATIEHVKIAKERKKAMVIGTTGLSEKERAIIEEAAESIPIVFSPNMSVAVNVFFSLIEKAAKTLGKDYSVSIKEAHHIHKKDKPSGTAKLMANIVKEKLGKTDVPIESIRENEIVGDHDITFEGKVDTLKISHSARTRDIFALGALKAARFVVEKSKGFFSMSDVLGM